MYDIKAHGGKSPLLLIAFSGVGDVANNTEVRFEWGNSLINACADAHILFIKDNARRWYTDENGHQGVADYIKGYQTEHGIERTVAFGLSMGGYGALVFSSLARFDDVVALAARSCVGEASQFDSRNRKLMKQLPEGPYSAISQRLTADTRYTFLSSLDQVNDLMHFHHHRQACPNGRFFVTRGDHNIGNEMNMRGEMGRFLAWLSGGCSASQAPPGITPATEAHFAVARHLVRAGRGAMGFKEWQQAFGTLAEEQLPLFLLPNKVQADIEAGLLTDYYPCPSHTFITQPYLQPYLGAGWYTAEAGGVWSQGYWHEIKGRLLSQSEGAAELEPRHIRLRFELYYPPSQNEPAVIEAWNEGERVKTMKVERKNRFPSVVIPLSIEPDGRFSLLLKTPGAIIPADVSDSGDTREIALFLKGFVVT
ncbi:MAG: hypothetical protein LAT65_21290 [Saccharospirillum sp.]|nr:hypothetical protein [Saccharospirillum sp.]